MDSRDTETAQTSATSESVADINSTTGVASTTSNTPTEGESLATGATSPSSPTKKHKAKMPIIIGIIAGLVVVIAVVIAIILISRPHSSFNDPFGSIDDLDIDEELSIQKGAPAQDTIVDKMAADFESGAISIDDYVMQLTYSIFEPTKVNEAYKSLEHGIDDIGALLSVIEVHLDDLSDDAVECVWDYLLLGGLQWDTGDKVSINSRNSTILASEAYPGKQSAGKLGVISDVVLSKNGHFLIFYGTSGKNATTKDTANKVGDYLEKTVDYYKKNYGYSYKYETISTTTRGSAIGAAEHMLDGSGIDVERLKTAMPVFLINIESDPAAGFYVSGISGGLYNVIFRICVRVENIKKVIKEGSKSEAYTAALGTYSYPFFAVNIHGIGTETYNVVLAHELFHHYQKYICGNGKYADCQSGLFTEETTADVAGISASGVNSTDTDLNTMHARIYIRDIEMSLDRLGDGAAQKKDVPKQHGYGAYIFGYNYMNMVKDGTRHLFESSKCTNALKCLYDNSGGMYDEVLLKTAERTLTLDYDNKTYIPYADGAPVYPAAHGNIEMGDRIDTKQETIAYSAQHYYYVEPSKYSDKAQITFKANSSNLHLLLFVRDGNGYKFAYSQPLDRDFAISIGTFCHYREIAFAIVNTAISGTANYTIGTDPSPTEAPTVTVESLKLETCARLSGNYKVISCYNVEDQETMRTVRQMYVSFDDNDIINSMYAKATIRLKRDGNKQIFGFAQTITSGLIMAIENAYKEQFKDIEMRTTESEDVYTVTIRVVGDYYASFKGYSFDDNSKLDIGRAIEEEGFKCLYD